MREAPKRTVTAGLTKPQIAAIQQLSDDSKLSVAEILRRAIDVYLDLCDIAQDSVEIATLKVANRYRSLRPSAIRPRRAVDLLASQRAAEQKSEIDSRSELHKKARRESRCAKGIKSPKSPT